MPRTTSRARAEAHEALFLRLCALLEQVAGVAVRHPGVTVPPETRAIAEALLFDSRPFTPGVRGFPAAAEHSAALASQLADTRAALEMWEAEHSHWNGECFVWRLTRGEEAMPIQRLRPRAKLAAHDPGERSDAQLRDALLRRIDARIRQGYDEGYADARAGRPNRDDPPRLGPGAADG